MGMVKIDAIIRSFKYLGAFNETLLFLQAVEGNESKTIAELAKASVNYSIQKIHGLRLKWDNFEQPVYRYVRDVPLLTYRGAANRRCFF